MLRALCRSSARLDTSSTNIQPREGPNPSGNSMVDGPTAAIDLDRTEANRELVRAFVASVRIAGNVDALDALVCTDHYTEHHASGVDGFTALKLHLESTSSVVPTRSQNLLR